MMIFNIPAIICTEPETTVRITLRMHDKTGTLEYIGGQRDGEQHNFGATDDEEVPFSNV